MPDDPKVPGGRPPSSLPSWVAWAWRAAAEIIQAAATLLVVLLVLAVVVVVFVWGYSLLFLVW